MNLFNNPYQQFQQHYPYTNNNINWVQGIEGAKAYQLQPNSNVILMDSENDGTFYIKVSDNVGMCNLRIFSYKEITTQSQNINPDEYVRKSDLKIEVENLINSMLGGKSNEQSISTTKSRKTVTE